MPSPEPSSGMLLSWVSDPNYPRGLEQLESLTHKLSLWHLPCEYSHMFVDVKEGALNLGYGPDY